MDWVLEWGRYGPQRSLGGGQELFDTHELVRNVRETKRIEVSEQGDGAFAVVDIVTLGRDLEGEEMGWKMTMHTGVLVYP